MPRLLAAVLGLLLLAPAAVAAGPPIMPLSEVRPGMQCTGLSVVKGTRIDSFDVVVEDVVGGDRGADAPRLLIRVSGPAVDRTGIGPGFSGSPVVCDGRIAGAISESVGDFGGDVVLATPIEQVLGEPVDAPSPRPVSASRETRQLGGLFTVTGVSGPVAAAVRRATKGRVLAIAPARFRAATGPSTLRPGSAFGVGLASGDLSAGAVGTVAYVDGDRVWGFGHALDTAGGRRLLLQEAYVYTVVGNPNATEDAQTYKLAAPTRDVGTLSNDAPAAVVGRTGPLPPRIAVRVIATDHDADRRKILELDVADESGIGLPAGQSALAAIAPVAVAQGAYTAMRGTPVRVTSRMCATFVLDVPKRGKLKLCNRYVGGGGGAAELAGAPAASDLSAAASLVDAYEAGPLRVGRLRVQLDLHRGLKLAHLTSLRGPRTVRRGRSYTYRLGLRAAFSGRRFSRRVRIRIPSSAPRGRRDLVLTGTPADEIGGGEEEIELDLDALDLAPDGPVSGPRSFSDLRDAVKDLERWDGVTGDVVARDEDPEEDDGFRAFRLRDVRIDGEARRSIRVR